MRSLIFIIMPFFCCCSEQYKKEEKLSDFITFASKASQNDSIITDFSFEIEGILILLPPYAIDQHFAEIKNIIGVQAAEDLRDETGLKEVFWIALFEQNKMIEIQKVDPSTLLFTEMLVVKFKRNENISLNFGKNRKVKNILVSQR